MYGNIHFESNPKGLTGNVPRNGVEQEHVEQILYRALREFHGTKEFPQYRGTHSDDGSSNFELNNNDSLPHKNEQSSSTGSGVHSGSKRLVFMMDHGVEIGDRRHQMRHDVSASIAEIGDRIKLRVNSQLFKRENFCWYCYEKCLETCAAESIIPPSVCTRCFWHQGHCMRDGKVVADFGVSGGHFSLPHEWVAHIKCRHCGAAARGPHANSHSPVLEFDKLSLHST
ncbi:unnamed protein product [Angiostrongylus costaricensis]|uniref:Phorbol-ester/DAG-type domain-containing protein n=1 Tax=Angiostrongylus costaricensis TaxID=334426 RepID=A0A0R3Q0S6_ANGCS|nr:unnamed protein product [Angiostrongylus costaricensis]